MDTYTDGASNSTGAGIGIVLEAPLGLKIEEARRLSFQGTNNRLLKVRSDSKLIVEQVVGRFEAKEPRMKAYFGRASALSR